MCRNGSYSSWVTRWNVLCKIFRRSRSRGPKLKVGSSSSTCLLKGELGKRLKISGGWTEKSTGESRAATKGSWAATEGICASSGKSSKIEEEDREVRKWESLTRSDVPKRQHCGRYEDDKRQDHNIDIPFEFHYSQKTTKPWPRFKFVMLMWLKKNETSRTEGAKVVIVWRWPKKALIWNLILDNRT